MAISSSIFESHGQCCLVGCVHGVTKSCKRHKLSNSNNMNILGRSQTSMKPKLIMIQDYLRTIEIQTGDHLHPDK